MRHRTKTLLLATLLGASLAACRKDWLDLTPATSYTAQNFPVNETQIEQAVVAQYQHARGLVAGSFWHLTEFTSDNTSFLYNATDRGGVPFEQLDEFTATSDNGTFGQIWGSGFNGVARANLVLQNIDRISFSTPERKRVAEAEARFWRAWNYFNLVQLFGAVPIVEQIVTSPEEAANFIDRRPVEEVYERAVLPDLALAVANAQPRATARPGRVTRGAALMLQAKVLMTLRRFPAAREALQALLREGYTLNANFANNFNPATKNSPEAILELQTDLAQGQSISFMGQWAPFGTGTRVWPGGTGSRSGTNQPTQDLIDAFEPNDRRFPVTIAFVNANDFTGILRTQYPNRQIAYSNKFNYWDATALGTNINFPLYRYADALLMLAECLNEEGFPNAQAFELLNSVRSRAGLPSKTQGNPVAALAVNSQAAFRLAIERERQVELAYENHRWFDLVRTGRATEVMTAHGVRERALKGTTIGPGAYQTIRLLFALPQIQVISYGIAQNPGW
jgi:starch-binding outer membrane protein, SusD/RagB family